MYRLAVLAGLALGLLGQAPGLKFDVASIKPSPDIRAVLAAGQMPHVGERVDGAQLDFGFASPQQLICVAYNVQPYQVVGPAWMASEHFDLQATLPQGAAPDQVPAMLQALLADRFGLKMHREPQAREVYALLAGPGGPKLSPSPAETAPAATTPDSGGTVVNTPEGPMHMTSSGTGGNRSMTVTGGRAGKVQITMSDGVMHLQAERLSMPELATALTTFLDLPVVDQTGIQGNYQVSLDIAQSALMQAARKAGAAAGIPLSPGANAPSASGPGAVTAPDPAGGSIFASVQKLGLKLDKRKAPVDDIVIDHMEKQPTAN